MKKQVDVIELRMEVVKVVIEGDEAERKAEGAKVKKLASDFRAQLISEREDKKAGKTFMTYQVGNEGEALKVLLSN